MKQLFSFVEDFDIDRMKRKGLKLLDYVVERSPDKLLDRTITKLSNLNQKESDMNRYEAFLIMLVAIAIGVVYGGVAYYFSHDLWYHKVLSIFSACVFSLNIWQNYFDAREIHVRKGITRTVEIFLGKYTIYKGNVVLALRETETRSNMYMKPFIRRIRVALEHENMDYEIAKAKEFLMFDWLKMFADLLLTVKKRGTIIDSNGRDTFKDTFEELNMFFANMDIMEDEIGLEHKSIESLMLLIPLGTVIGVRVMYGTVFKDFPAILTMYDSVQAKNIVALLFLGANLSALFTRWVRKHQS